MNAPYDGDRRQRPEEGPYQPDDPYRGDGYPADPYQPHTPSPQYPGQPDPYGQVPGYPNQPGPGPASPQHPPVPGAPEYLGPYQQPGPHGQPDPAGQPDPYGPRSDDTQYLGTDGALSSPRGTGPRHTPSGPAGQDDAFAHLFRDQGQPAQPPAPGPYQPPPGPTHPTAHPGQAPQSPHDQWGYSPYPGPAQTPGQQPQQGYAAPPGQPFPDQPPYGQPGQRYPRQPGQPDAYAEQPGGPGHPGHPAAYPGQAQGQPGHPGQQWPTGAGTGPVPPGGPVGTPPVPPPTPPGPPGPSASDDARGEPEEPPPSASSGGGGLLKSSAIMAAGTMVSRLTGFVRSAMIVSALGAAMLGDSYTTAITLPTMIYILTVGGGLNSVFVPQLVRAMKEDEDGGEAYANRLLTLVAVILGVLALAAVFAAPVLLPMMSMPLANNAAASEVTITFIRYCVPSIFFMGIHVVMGQILNARGRFGAMMWTPVLNNIVIITTIGLFLWVYGTSGDSRMTVSSIPPEGVRLLGVGTLLGLIVQSLAMIPYLRATGFRVRPRFDWRGHGLGKAAKLAKWTILFVLANQAGVVVVTQLSTASGAAAADAGFAGTGYTAYTQAQLIWNMPQSIITVSVMAALLPRLARAAHDGDTGAVRDDISHGLRNSAVAIVPIAFGLVALGIPMCTFIYGSSGLDQAQAMGYTLMAFGVGLIPFSVQYVVLRAFYAYEDTRTPFFNTVIVAAVNAAASALCYLMLPARWAVVGMAASYGLAYLIGVGIAWRRLSRDLGGDLDGPRVLRTYVRLAGASVPAALAAGAAAWGITQALGSGFLGSSAALIGGGISLAVVFVLAAKRMRIEEMTAMLGMVRARLGR
ncbi:murein biosynthesis integral membrane protein MurJ [Streptomyces sp. AJS327]|uniref:murein biosynthesis integral membrane protein MurJ n=1 Tax=Streptomyces sp. AJS327 TaxID=2545265 RepID=UPI0015DFFA86|nr:murein biosynthesis integral membrane protein MurJ [Streptomyces sp. AJS327]MBA0052828.1 murein biosynthesis integral membrane protein MurJ [Streptomyces sp. AJS327]